MNDQEHEDNRENYKPKMYEKINELKMTPLEYQIFLLQGIKKELITIRKQLTEK